MTISPQAWLQYLCSVLETRGFVYLDIVSKLSSHCWKTPYYRSLHLGEGGVICMRGGSQHYKVKKRMKVTDIQLQKVVPLFKPRATRL